jgi:methyl-accepting chemotaxis protein
MADSDVEVKFGARIDDLTKAVNEAKGKIDELKSHVESVSSATDTISNGFKALAAIIATAFSIDKIKDFIGRMATLGEHTESLSK